MVYWVGYMENGEEIWVARLAVKGRDTISKFGSEYKVSVSERLFGSVFM